MNIASKLMDDGNYYFPVNGHFVSEKQRRIAEILKDYDPTLELQWIPPAERSSSDLAFRVVHRPPGRPPYVVLTAVEADERLLTRVLMADQQKAAQALGNAGNHLNFIDMHNKSIELMQAKAAEEKRQEAHEMAYAAYRSPKIHYRIKANGKILDFGKSFGGRFG